MKRLTIESEAKRLIMSLVLAAILVVVPVTVAQAATSQTVTVTATPSYTSIVNSPATWALGTVAGSSSYWANGAGEPAWPINATGCHFLVNNTGSVAVNITIAGADFVGGVGWDLSTAVGQNIVVMKAWKLGDAQADNVTLSNSTTPLFIAGLANGTTKDWELKLEIGTFNDSVAKSANVTLSAQPA